MTVTSPLGLMAGFAVLLSLAACAAKTSEQDIRAIRPDCARAQEQIRILETERAETAEQVGRGVQSVCVGQQVLFYGGVPGQQPIQAT